MIEMDIGVLNELTEMKGYIFKKGLKNSIEMK